MSSPELRADLVAFAARRTGRARLTITGTSMEPLLRAGMVVEIEPLVEEPRIGDILVFRTATGLAAHRLVGGERFTFSSGPGVHRLQRRPAARFITSGDAHPHRLERVAAETVVGRVTAVWENARPDARRIDDDRFRRDGRWRARTRSVRVVVRRVRVLVALLAVSPTEIAEPPAFAAIVAASHAFERGRYADGVAIVRSVPAAAAVDMARRHHASGLFAEWLAAAAARGVDVPADLAEAFRRIRWTNALQADRVLRCVGGVRDRFDAAGIPHIVLKGGARLAAGEPGAALHFSGDVDVLVPAESVDAAMDALRVAGYRDLRPPAERFRYSAARLHHREPLRSPDDAIPVEVHVALAEPGSVSERLDFATFAPCARLVHGPAGDVVTLDAVASAVHLAYHARDLQVWRDIVLLARYLRGFAAAERARFDAYVRAERRDRLRLTSAVAVADALAFERPVDSAAGRAYLAWAVLREDLPRRFAPAAIVESVMGRCVARRLRPLAHRSRRAWLRCILRDLAGLPAIASIVVRRQRGGASAATSRK